MPNRGCAAQASDIIKKGKMCSLFINDLDAGAGRMGESTQYTVNNQCVHLRDGVLVNCADSAVRGRHSVHPVLTLLAPAHATRRMVNATLMNIADNPTNVQLPGVYKNEEIPRVPIVCTGACARRWALQAAGQVRQQAVLRVQRPQGAGGTLFTPEPNLAL